jgi:hypothetical protein
MVPEMLFQPMESEDACQARASWLARHRQAVKHVMYPPHDFCRDRYGVSRRRIPTRAEMRTNEGFKLRGEYKRGIDLVGSSGWLLCVLPATIFVKWRLAVQLVAGNSETTKRIKRRTKRTRECRSGYRRCGSQLGFMARPHLRDLHESAL